jgi:hypothetical protein
MEEDLKNKMENEPKLNNEKTTKKMRENKWKMTKKKKKKHEIKINKFQFLLNLWANFSGVGSAL